MSINFKFLNQIFYKGSRMSMGNERLTSLTDVTWYLFLSRAVEKLKVENVREIIWYPIMVYRNNPNNYQNNTRTQKILEHLNNIIMSLPWNGGAAKDEILFLFLHTYSGIFQDGVLNNDADMIDLFFLKINIFISNVINSSGTDTFYKNIFKIKFVIKLFLYQHMQIENGNKDQICEYHSRVDKIFTVILKEIDLLLNIEPELNNPVMIYYSERAPYLQPMERTSLIKTGIIIHILSHNLNDKNNPTYEGYYKDLVSYKSSFLSEKDKWGPFTALKDETLEDCFSRLIG